MPPCDELRVLLEPKSARADTCSPHSPVMPPSIARLLYLMPLHVSAVLTGLHQACTSHKT